MADHTTQHITTFFEDAIKLAREPNQSRIRFSQVKLPRSKEFTQQLSILKIVPDPAEPKKPEQLLSRFLTQELKELKVPLAEVRFEKLQHDDGTLSFVLTSDRLLEIFSKLDETKVASRIADIVKSLETQEKPDTPLPPAMDTPSEALSSEPAPRIDTGLNSQLKEKPRFEPPTPDFKPDLPTGTIDPSEVKININLPLNLPPRRPR